MAFVRLPRLLVRLEGLAALGAALTLYFHAGYGWVLLVVLVLAPDLSMVGYLAGPRAGAVSALIWIAHISADRLLGYGLKYPTAFRDGHLQRI